MTNLHPRYIASHVYRYHPRAHTVELFLDYNCPFSGKLFKKMIEEVIPVLEKEGKHNFVFINVIQPWHAFQSGVLHEVSFAVARVAPGWFWEFSKKMFENITEFYDTEVSQFTRDELIEKVLKVASEGDEDESILNIDSIKSLVAISNTDRPSNPGSGVAVDTKYFTRYARTIGVHVTPTISVNGIVISEIDSSTESARIIEILQNV
ncbi:hypothetical protein CANINC_001214 [Pichia inconspicua]|uniref:Thioredoxin-like fold domain-containing protein n=1 Tax=Pichia inconspicua TaxID=52247 RepID=A0A4T0X5E3_9ASCO|nr:hypothetical protein CANINC_001214 [[Candida] inconspicua]